VKRVQGRLLDVAPDASPGCWRPGWRVEYLPDMRGGADTFPAEGQDAWGNDLTLISSFLALSPRERLDAWEGFTCDLLEMRHHALVLPEAPAPDPRRA
jgi:hypothetical protein